MIVSFSPFSGRSDGRRLIQYTDLDAPDDDLF